MEGSSSQNLLKNKADAERILEFAEKFCSESRNTSDADKIKFFLRNPEFRYGIQSSHLGKKTKIQSVADEHRAKGVSLFVKAGNEGRKERLLDSLYHFNMGLLHSVFDSEISRIEASKIFANRSAVFFDLKRYEDALRDVEIALELNYPFEHKVWSRKAKIYLAQGKYSTALAALEFMERSPKLAMDREINKTVDVIRKTVMESIRRNPTCGENQSLYFGPAARKFNTRNFEENPAFQYASSRIKIQYDNDRTRHVIASQSIEPGDVIFDEVPFASILIPESYHDYCYYCHTFLDGYVFPCKTCSEVRYCGEDCYNESWSQYHCFECLNGFFFLQKVGLCHLAVRIVLIAGADNVLEVVEASKRLSKPEDSIAIFCNSSEGDSKKREYRRIYSLVEHSNKMSPMDLFTYAKTSAGVTDWLQTSSGFLKGKTEDEIIVIGGAIFHHLCQLISNAQRLYSFQRDPDGGIIDYERIIIGSGIYASTSLMNHSCDPNISTNYKLGPREGRRLIVKATRQIKAGEEVVNSYGVTYSRHDFPTRQSSMSDQYFFDCKCHRCADDLLAINANGCNFVEKFESIFCPSCSSHVYSSAYDFKSELSCRNCGNIDDKFRKIRRKFNKSKALRIEGETLGGDQGHQKLLESHKIIESHLPPSHRLIAESHNALAKSYISLGQPWNAVSHSRKSLEYVKDRFGSNSNEYGLELRNYAELLEILELQEDDLGQKSKDLMNIALACLEAYFPSI